MDELKPFSPSIDWGRALVDSVIWIARAWAIAAVCTLVVLALIARLPTWGRQFWRVTGAYFTGPHSVKAWLSLAALLLSVIVGVRLNVLFSYQSNDMTRPRRSRSGHRRRRRSGQRVWQARAFGVAGHLRDAGGVLVARVMLDLFMTQRFMLAWRVWLTDRLTGDWLDGRAYYRGRFIDETIDNPDQRIQSDIDVFTADLGPQPNTPHQTSNGTLLFGAISSIVSVISFTADPVEPVRDRVAVRRRPCRGRCSGSVFVYVARRDRRRVLARPPDHLAVASTTRSSTPRSVTRWCGCGMPPKRWPSTAARSPERPSAASAGSSRWCPTTSASSTGPWCFIGWNLSMSHIILPPPWLLQAPRLFAGQIQLGDGHPVGDGVRHHPGGTVVLPQLL